MILKSSSENFKKNLVLNFFSLAFCVFFIFAKTDVFALVSCLCTIEVKNNECLIKGSAQIPGHTKIKDLKKFTTYTKIDPQNTTCGITGLTLWSNAMKDLDKQKIEIPEGTITQEWEMQANDFLGTCNFLVDNGSFYSSQEKTEFFGPGSSYQIACEGGEVDAESAPPPPKIEKENYDSFPLELAAIQAMGLKLKKTSADSVQDLAGKALKAFMQVLGSIALAMFVYGGFMVMASGGNEEKSGKGTQILVWSALGVIIILSAYMLVKFVLEIIG